MNSNDLPQRLKQRGAGDASFPSVSHKIPRNTTPSTTISTSPLRPMSDIGVDYKFTSFRQVDNGDHHRRMMISQDDYVLIDKSMTTTCTNSSFSSRDGGGGSVGSTGTARSEGGGGDDRSKKYRIRNEVAQRMNDTIARVQSNRQSRREKRLLSLINMREQQQQQQQQQQPHVKSKQQQDLPRQVMHSKQHQQTDQSQPQQHYQDIQQEEQMKQDNDGQDDTVRASVESTAQREGSFLPMPNSSTSSSRQSYLLNKQQRTANGVDKTSTFMENTYSKLAIVRCLSNDHSSVDYHDPIRRYHQSHQSKPGEFCDNISIDNTSVYTGMSQQDLLRKKVREHNKKKQQKSKSMLSSGQQNRHQKNRANSISNNKKKRNGPIVQIPTSLLLMPKPRVSGPAYIRARSRAEGDDDISSLGMAWNNKKDNKSKRKKQPKTNSTKEQQQQQLLQQKPSKTTSLSMDESTTADTTIDGCCDNNDNKSGRDQNHPHDEFDTISISSFPLLSKRAQRFRHYHDIVVQDEDYDETRKYQEQVHQTNTTTKSQHLQSHQSEQHHEQQAQFSTRVRTAYNPYKDDVALTGNVSRALLSSAEDDSAFLTTSSNSNKLNETETTEGTRTTSTSARYTVFESHCGATHSSSAVSAASQQNRVRFADTIATFLELEQYDEQTRAVSVHATLMEKIQSKIIRKDNLSDIEIPWDETSRTPLIQNSPETNATRSSSGTVPSILRKPKFSYKAKTNRSSVLMKEREDRAMYDTIDPETSPMTDELQFVNVNAKIMKRNFGMRFDNDDNETQPSSTSSPYRSWASTDFEDLHVNKSCEVSPPRENKTSFLDTQGFELSPIQPNRVVAVSFSEEDDVRDAIVNEEEPISNRKSHPAERHEKSSSKPSINKSIASKAKPLLHATDEPVSIIKALPVTLPAHCTITADVVNNEGRYYDEKKDDDDDDEYGPFPCSSHTSMTDDESTVFSAFAFIQTVAAVVIQTAVRRHQARIRHRQMLNSRKLVRDIQNILSSIESNDVNTQFGRKNIQKDDASLNRKYVGKNAAGVKSIIDNKQVTNERSFGNGRKEQHSESESVPDSATNSDTIGEDVVNLYALAAVRIQAFFRGFWVRDSIDVDHYCAALIQKAWRKCRCRRIYAVSCRRILIIQSLWRRRQARYYASEVLGYVVWIQSMYRGYRTRKLMEQYTNTVVKEWQDSNRHRALRSRREYFMSSRQSSGTKSTSESFLSLYSSEKNSDVVTNAAVKIQTRWRTFACECQLIRSLVDVLIAQTVVRRWLAHRRFATLKNDGCFYRHAPNKAKLGGFVATRQIFNAESVSSIQTGSMAAGSVQKKQMIMPKKEPSDGDSEYGCLFSIDMYPKEQSGSGASSLQRDKVISSRQGQGDSNNKQLSLPWKRLTRPIESSADVEESFDEKEVNNSFSPNTLTVNQNYADADNLNIEMQTALTKKDERTLVYNKIVIAKVGSRIKQDDEWWKSRSVQSEPVDEDGTPGFHSRLMTSGKDNEREERGACMKENSNTQEEPSPIMDDQKTASDNVLKNGTQKECTSSTVKKTPRKRIDSWIKNPIESSNDEFHGMIAESNGVSILRDLERTSEKHFTGHISSSIDRKSTSLSQTKPTTIVQSKSTGISRRVEQFFNRKPGSPSDEIFHDPPSPQTGSTVVYRTPSSCESDRKPVLMGFTDDEPLSPQVQHGISCDHQETSPRDQPDAEDANDTKKIFSIWKAKEKMNSPKSSRFFKQV